MAKSDKTIWVSEALHFFAAFLVGYILLPVYTKFHGTETAVVMIFIGVT